MERVKNDLLMRRPAKRVEKDLRPRHECARCRRAQHLLLREGCQGEALRLVVVGIGMLPLMAAAAATARACRHHRCAGIKEENGQFPRMRRSERRRRRRRRLAAFARAAPQRLLVEELLLTELLLVKIRARFA